MYATVEQVLQYEFRLMRSVAVFCFLLLLILLIAARECMMYAYESTVSGGPASKQ